jgi:hypothetical protein
MQTERKRKGKINKQTKTMERDKGIEYNEQGK